MSGERKQVTDSIITFQEGERLWATAVSEKPSVCSTDLYPLTRAEGDIMSLCQVLRDKFGEEDIGRS